MRNSILPTLLIAILSQPICYAAADKLLPSDNAVSVTIVCSPGDKTKSDYTTLMTGQKAKFTLALEGDPAGIVWSIFPKETQGFDSYEKGSIADFSTEWPGTYVVFCSVSGQDGSVAHAVHVVELQENTHALDGNEQAAVSGTVQGAVGRQRPKPTGTPYVAKARSTVPARSAVEVPEVTVETVQSRIIRWSTEVKSENKKSDARQIASVFRQVANGVLTGTAPSNANALIQDAKGICRVSMTASFVNWEGWFEKVDKMFDDSKADAPRRANAMVAIAKMLEDGAR